MKKDRKTVSSFIFKDTNIIFSVNNSKWKKHYIVLLRDTDDLSKDTTAVIERVSKTEVEVSLLEKFELAQWDQIILLGTPV
jgi:fibronectin type 3 domain-containing protein